MKNTFDRDWLEDYKINPKRDNTIYKNYQNPSMTNWERQMGGLSSAQKGRYDQFLNTIPDELKGLSAKEMQNYLQGVDEKQKGLAQERAGYDAQIQKLKQQQEAKRLAEIEARDMLRPYRSHTRGINGGPTLTAKYTDNDYLVPFNILLKRITGVSDQIYAKYYRGHGRGEDPYRPYAFTEHKEFNPYAYYLAPSGTANLRVPQQVLEEIATQRGKKYDPTSRDTYHYRWLPPKNI